MQVHTYSVQTTDQERLHIQVQGNPTAPILVFVHGYPDHQDVWDPLIQLLEKDYYIVRYDVRGAGQSSIPKKIYQYRLAQLSDDLFAVTQMVLGERAFHLIAHDWGSIQSWESVTDLRFEGKILSFMTISGPCLDHAAFWMRKQAQSQQTHFFKQLTKSWYIAAFQLPLLAPTVWRFFQPNWWQKVLERLENQKNLPCNENIQQDGRYGVNLYRANFIPRLVKPRQRYAICPVRAVVLKQDQFVSPELVDEMQHWVRDFSQVELDANHWAVLSQPKKIAALIRAWIVPVPCEK